MKRLVVAVGIVAGSALAAGCSANNPSPVSAAAAKALKPLVKNLRQAASGNSVSAVRLAEQALNNEVDQLVQSNDLTPNRGQNIQNAAATLLSDFRHKVAVTSSPTVTQTPTSTPTPTETPTPTSTPTPSPTVTITVPPTQTPTETTTATTTATATSTKSSHSSTGFGGGVP